MIRSSSSRRFALRTLAAASALAVAPAALAATVTILDNADRPRTQTSTTYDAAGVPTVATPPAINPTVDNQFYFKTAIDASYTDGFHADRQNSGVPGPNATVVTYSVNAPTSITGAAVSIPANTNQDVTTTPGGIGISSFTAYSTLAQALGLSDLARISTNPPATGGKPLFYSADYLGFGSYNDRSTPTNPPIVGYFLDASDYSGKGNLRYMYVDSVAVLAGNNTYTGDTYVGPGATVMVVSNRIDRSYSPNGVASPITSASLGNGTLILATEASSLIFNTPGAQITLLNAISGSGQMVFMGDTAIGGGAQTTTLTYDNTGFTGVTRIESGINGANTLRLGDGSTSGSTANTGTLGTATIEVGRLDSDRAGKEGAKDGSYAASQLPKPSDSDNYGLNPDGTPNMTPPEFGSARLVINLSGTKTLGNTINLHGASELVNQGSAAGDITLTGSITSGDYDTVRIRNANGKLTLNGAITLGESGVTVLRNDSAGAMTVNGDISTGGFLQIYNNGTGNLVLNGSVSGSVFIDQNGASTTTLTGDNSFVGIISVNNAAGVLEFTGSNSLGQGGIKLAGGTLKLGGTTAATISNSVNLAESSNLQTDADLTFTGAFTSPVATSPVLTKIGAAKLILTGNNDTFAGTFVVADNGGTLQAGNGGTTGTFGTKAIQVGADATVAVNRSDAEGVTVGNLISGAGNFEQLGTGLTLMTGANTYTGTTHVAAGTLQVGDGVTSGNLGTGAVTVDAGATLAFKRSDDVVVANAIGGAGNLLQNGTGATFLTGANTYTGTTTITDGALVIGNAGTTGSIGSGAVVNDATLGFYRTDNFTVANTISGTGTLRKALSNTVTLSGPVSGQSVWVEAGTLNVTNGSAFGSVRVDAGTANLAGTVAGAVTIASGATLNLGAGTSDTTSALNGPSAAVDGVMNLNSAANYTLANYSGAGVIEQKGAGEITLSDSAADFTGTIKVSAGTASFDSAADLDTATVEFNGGTVAYTSTGAITLTNALTATADLSYLVMEGAVTWTGALSGTGHIRVSGAGATSFVVNGTAIVNGTSTVVGGVTFEANTLDLAGADATAGATFVDTANPVDVTNSSGTLATFTGDQTGTAAGIISGNLSLEKTGTTLLTLTGANTYTGGTIVSGGTLLAGNDSAFGTGTITLSGGTLAASGGARTLANAVSVTANSGIGGTEALTLSGAVNIAAASTLTVTNTAATDITGALSGTGTLAVSGATTTLTNAAGFGGAYAVGSGAKVVLNVTGNDALTNAVSGAGTFELAGSGVTTVTTSVLNSATTTVASGRTLDLGANPAVAQLSALTVASGATLRGQGTLGALVNHGTVSPGNSPGIIVVNGDFTNTGTLNIEIAGTGAPGATDGYDQIQVGGTANLGGTLSIDFTGGSVIPGNHTYRIIEASAVTGAFATTTIAQPLPAGLYSMVAVDASGVVFSTFDNIASAPGMDVPSELVPFAAALTQNSSAFAEIRNILATSGGAAASQALVNSSPVGLGALNALAVDEARGTTELMRTRLDSRRRAMFESGYQPVSTYANVTGANTNVDSDAATFDRDYFGGKGGLERVGNDGMTLGANVGYDKGRASFHNGGGKVTQDHLSASGYVSHQFDRRSFMYLGAFGGLSSYDSERNTVLGKASGDTNGWDLGATALLGYEIRANEDISVTPYAGVTYMRSHFSAFNEKGAGALNLDMEEGEYDSLRTKVGADIDWKLPTGDIDLRLGLGIAWEHELLDDEATLTGAFANGAGGTFETESAMLSRDTLSVGPQATFAYGDGNQIRLGYRYQYGFGDETGHRFDLTFSTRF